MIVTTTPTLEGMKITAYLNIVFGEVIIGTDIGRDFAAGFTNLFGGRSSEYEEALTDARQEAIKEMKKRAAAMGANAVVGVDIDYEALGQMMMVTASGTAVAVEFLEEE
ncbi:MAG: YbjQ family protein [Clostridiales bacterium]|nr:YbjQ family protein [Clostridiales bacterium]